MRNRPEARAALLLIDEYGFNITLEVGPVSLVGWIVIGLLGFNVLFIIFLRLIIWLEDRRGRK